MVVALVLDALLPSRQALDASRSLVEAAEPWTLSKGMRVQSSGPSLRFTGEGPGPHTATRRLAVAAGAEFIRLEACTTRNVAPEQVAIMLASVVGGVLDFNRSYSVGAVDGAQAGQCFSEYLPRRAGDGAALLQVQLMGAGPSAVSLSHLSVTALEENALWRWLRRAMLMAGLLLIALRIRGYASARPRVLAAGGLAVVAGIVFGCTVSVALKADIYALLTGGRSLPVPRELSGLLLEGFPVGGFSIFTGMHAALFACATLLLGLLRGGRALTDLLLLGAATETLQLFVPGRGPGVSDMIVDWIGVGVGALLVFLLRRSQRVRLLLKDEGVDEDVARL